MKRAAATYSRSLTDIDRLRTTRAESCQPNAASMTTSRSHAYCPLGPPWDTMAMRKNDGRTSMRSMTQSHAFSYQPPM